MDLEGHHRNKAFEVGLGLSNAANGLKLLDDVFLMMGRELRKVLRGLIAVDGMKTRDEGLKFIVKIYHIYQQHTFSN